MSPESATLDDSTAADPAAAAVDATEAEAPLFEISTDAMAIVLDARSTEDEPEAYALRVEITGAKGVDFVYDLAFDRLDKADPTDVILDLDTVSVIVPADTVANLTGSVLDVAQGGKGLAIRNPNRPNPMAGVDLELTGDVAERVQQLLDLSINPSLATHGGFATLVGVDDDNNVFITMGGGCQGCAMSRMTLTQGIQKTILEAIPEVTEVIDATDHASGDNPFYS